MMIGLCEVNLGGSHEGESSETLPALTPGQGVEQNFQRVIRNSRKDETGSCPTRRMGAASRPGGMNVPRKAPNKANCLGC